MSSSIISSRCSCVSSTRISLDISTINSKGLLLHRAFSRISSDAAYDRMVDAAAQQHQNGYQRQRSLYLHALSGCPRPHTGSVRFPSWRSWVLCGPCNGRITVRLNNHYCINSLISFSKPARVHSRTLAGFFIK